MQCDPVVPGLSRGWLQPFLRRYHQTKNSSQELLKSWTVIISHALFQPHRRPFSSSTSSRLSPSFPSSAVGFFVSGNTSRTAGTRPRQKHPCNYTRQQARSRASTPEICTTTIRTQHTNSLARRRVRHPRGDIGHPPTHLQHLRNRRRSIFDKVLIKRQRAGDTFND